MAAEESQSPQDQSFLSRHGCLLTIVAVLIVGAGGRPVGIRLVARTRN